MSGDVSVIYLTYRQDPHFHWFADSLARQVDGGVDVILVDGAWSSERTARFTTDVRGRFPLTHVAAKPSPYAGPHRLTRRDFFAAASARNTGVMHATAQYLVFADDLSILMPGWWDEVQRAAAAGEVVAGAYQKHSAMQVDDGVLLSSRSAPAGIDARWQQGRDDETVALAGNQLYGCSFGVPRELMCGVNGCDELCDSIGGEDWHLGVRLEWMGATIRYARRMLTIESEELHGVGVPAQRIDKKVPPNVYLRRLYEFGVRARSTDGSWDSSHMIVDILFGTRSTQTLGNYYLLSELTPDGASDTVRRFPKAHWFDRQPLSQL